MASNGFFNPFLSGGGGVGGKTSADKVSYDNGKSGLAADNVQAAIDKLAYDVNKLDYQRLRIETIGYYLYPDKWEGDLYKIESEKIKAGYYISLDMARGITYNEYTALAAAMIINTEQTDGEIVVKALGEVPTIIIPISITFFMLDYMAEYILVDSVTGIGYQIIAEDGNAQLVEASASGGDQMDYIITDSITGVNYKLVVENRRVKLVEAEQETGYAYIVTDTVTGQVYEMVVENRDVQLKEVN